MKLKAIALTLCLATAPIGGCAAVAYLPTVIAAVTDALMVLDAIEDFVATYFAVRPDSNLQEKVDATLTRAKRALNVALRASQGADKLTQAQIDAAFAEFRLAYAALLELVGPLGVSTGDSLRAVPGGLYVPEPLALTLRAK